MLTRALFSPHRIIRGGKVLAVTLVVSVLPVIIYGTFRNEFIRVSLVMACAAFGFFAEEHFLIRIIVSALPGEPLSPSRTTS